MTKFRAQLNMVSLDERIVPTATPSGQLIWLDDDTFQVGDMTFDIDTNATNNECAQFGAGASGPLGLLAGQILTPPPKQIPTPTTPPADSLAPAVNPTGTPRQATPEEAARMAELQLLLGQLEREVTKLKGDHDKLGGELKAIQEQQVKDQQLLNKANSVLQTLEASLAERISFYKSRNWDDNFINNQPDVIVLQNAIAAQKDVVADYQNRVNSANPLIAAKTEQMNAISMQIGRLYEKIYEVNHAIASMTNNINSGGTLNAVMAPDHVLAKDKLGGNTVPAYIP
jgi:hypothetical protein